MNPFTILPVRGTCESFTQPDITLLFKGRYNTDFARGRISLRL